MDPAQFSSDEEDDAEFLSVMLYRQNYLHPHHQQLEAERAATRQNQLA